MPETLLERYRAMIRSGEIGRDQAQALAVEKLQLLANRLASYSPPAKTDIFSFFTRRSGRGSARALHFRPASGAAKPC